MNSVSAELKSPEICGGRGRKAEQIFAAAQAIFLEQGYSAASMDAVAARAGVSKATIYVHFANKRALFEAIIHRRAESVFGQLELPDTEGDVRQILRDLAHRYVAMVNSPEAVAMYRVVLAEARHQPEVGEAFFLAGPVYGRRKVGLFFSALSQRGLLNIAESDAVQVSDLFLSMLAGESHLRALFGLPSDAAQIDRVVDSAVDLVLRSYAPPATMQDQSNG